MKSQILTFFEGEINDVKFNNEQIYYSTEYILDKIEEQFGEIYNNDFVEELRNFINIYMNKMDYPAYAKLESIMTSNIEDAKTFEQIIFTEPYIQYLNDGLSTGLYTK
jgi:hypothetical protein